MENVTYMWDSEDMEVSTRDMSFQSDQCGEEKEIPVVDNWRTDSFRNDDHQQLSRQIVKYFILFSSSRHLPQIKDDFEGDVTQ